MQRLLRPAAIAAALLLAACRDATLPTALPDAQTAPSVHRLAGLDDVTRGLALALARPELRIGLRDAWRASPWNEHKLVLQELATTPLGDTLVAAASLALGRSSSDFRALLAGLPPLDFYVPIADHRRTWSGGELMVLSSPISDADTVAGFDVRGTRVVYDAPRALGNRPFALLHPGEYKGRRIAPQLRAEGAVIQDADDGQSTYSVTTYLATGDSIVMDYAGDFSTELAVRMRLAAKGSSTMSAPSRSALLALSSPVDTTKIAVAMAFGHDGVFGETEQELIWHAAYYRGDGTVGSRMTIRQSHVPQCYVDSPLSLIQTDTECEELYFTPPRPAIFERVREASTEYIGVYLWEDDVFKDDDYGSVRVHYYDNGKTVSWIRFGTLKAKGIYVWTRKPAFAVARVEVLPYGNFGLAVGATQQVSAKAYASNDDEIVGRTPTWHSTNPAVATVSATGLVRAVAGGYAQIVATIDGVTGSRQVNVSGPPPPVASVEIIGEALYVGRVVELYAVAYDAYGGKIGIRPAAWSSSDPAIASVVAQSWNSAGAVSGHAEGTVTISATVDGVTGSSTRPVTRRSITVGPISVQNPVPAYAECGHYVSVEGGLQPYTYRWSVDGKLKPDDGYGGMLFTNGGVPYTASVTVTDANGTSDTSSLLVEISDGVTGLACLQ